MIRIDDDQAAALPDVLPCAPHPFSLLRDLEQAIEDHDHVKVFKRKQRVLGGARP